MRRRTQNFWSIGLSFPLGVLAAITARFAVLLPGYYSDALADNPAFRTAFETEGVHGLMQFMVIACALGCVLFLIGSLIGVIYRRPWSLALLRKCYITVYVLGGLYLCVISKVTWHIVDYKLPVRGVVTTSVTGFFWWYQLCWPAVAGVAFLALMHLLSWRRVVLNEFTGATETAPAMGDLVLENLRTHGRQPLYRKCIYSSLSVHLFVLVVVPCLLSLRGCVQPYRVPKGSGTATSQQQMIQVKIIKAVKKSKKRKLLVNPHSAISFHVPDLDESGIDRAVEHDTQVTYQADPARVLASAGAAGGGGRLGAGGGTKGGWPDGMDNALVRFIRLEYNGAEWDTGMDAVTRSDINFLEEFHKETGFKTASKGESHPVASLAKYPKGMAPPFVFMTGSGEIGVSVGDMKILRDYLLDGGLLFVNCGSAQFDRAFRNFIQQVLPGNPLVVIADDDPLFQMPYVFPNGAPPLWHHGGTHAMGVKVNDRWVVFYHPGDIVDAWKAGHEGLSPKLAIESYQVGINVIYYSFTHYLEMTRRYRK